MNRMQLAGSRGIVVCKMSIWETVFNSWLLDSIGTPVGNAETFGIWRAARGSRFFPPFDQDNRDCPVCELRRGRSDERVDDPDARECLWIQTHGRLHRGPSAFYAPIGPLGSSLPR